MMNKSNFYNYKNNEFPFKFSIKDKKRNENNFSNFLYNSNWNIELGNDNESNKNNVESIHGKIDKNDISKYNILNNIFPNIDLILPINIKENQMLIFNSKEEKIFLKYFFPINLKNGSMIRNVNKDLIN